MAKRKKTLRRGNGEGCISQREDGRWQGYIVLDNGKRKSVSRKTRKEVVEKLDEMRLKKRQGLPIDAEKITFSQYAENWIENTMRLEWKPTTLRRNQDVLRLHIEPHIGKIQLSKLNDDHLDDMQSSLEKSGASAFTRDKVHKFVSAVLTHARKRKKISSNPADLSNRPKLPHMSRPTFSQEQLRSFHKGITGTELEAVFMLAALCGMRQGEILALRWQDIDFDQGTVSVHQSLMQVSRKDMQLVPPKTARSERTFPPHGLAMESLKRHQAREAIRREKCKPQEEWSELVFLWKDGGPIPSRNLRRIYEQILKKAGLPYIRFHDLRHTVGTQLMKGGENPKIVAELLGHSDVRTTLQTYSHASSSMTAAAAHKMGAILEAEKAETVAEL